MSYEYEAADEMVKMALRGMETGVRMVESGTERLIRVVYLLMKDKRVETKQAREAMGSLFKQRKNLKAFSMYDEDLKKFSSLAKLYGINFFILKDESYNDSITDIVIEESDANKVNHIYKMLNMQSPERIRRGGVSPVLDPKVSAKKEEKKSERKDENMESAKKKNAPETKSSLEEKLKENEQQIFNSRRYNLPKSPEERDALKNGTIKSESVTEKSV